MSLRPRYSLLTLLLLTALVAGGVKLWYGPHHVVERTKPDLEVECSFTLDWNGDRILHGPHIEREFKPGTAMLETVTIECYRHGMKLPWAYQFVEDHLFIIRPLSLQFLTTLDLSAAEQLACKTVIEREQKRLLEQGSKAYGIYWEVTEENQNTIWSYRYIE